MSAASRATGVGAGPCGARPRGAVPAAPVPRHSPRSPSRGRGPARGPDGLADRAVPGAAAQVALHATVEVVEVVGARVDAVTLIPGSRSRTGIRSPSRSPPAPVQVVAGGEARGRGDRATLQDASRHDARVRGVPSSSTEQAPQSPASQPFLTSTWPVSAQQCAGALAGPRLRLDREPLTWNLTPSPPRRSRVVRGRCRGARADAAPGPFRGGGARVCAAPQATSTRARPRGAARGPRRSRGTPLQRVTGETRPQALGQHDAHAATPIGAAQRIGVEVGGAGDGVAQLPCPRDRARSAAPRGRRTAAVTTTNTLVPSGRRAP